MQTNNVVMIFGHIFAENKPERAVVQLFFPSLIGPPADQAAGVTLSDCVAGSKGTELVASDTFARIFEPVQAANVCLFRPS